MFVPNLEFVELFRRLGLASVDYQPKVGQRFADLPCPCGSPPLTVDTAIFEMWLGSLSTHQGLAIPVV